MPEALAILPVLLTATAPFDLATGTGVIAGTTFIGGTAIGSAALISTVSGVALSVGLSVGLSYAASLFATKPSAPNQASQVTINESTAPRVRAYGRCMLGGARMLWDNAPTSAGNLRIVAVVHCQGPIDAIEDYWFGDEVATFSSFPAFGAIATVSTPMTGHAALQSFSGSGAQTESSHAATWYSLWSSTDRARGLCYTVVTYGPVAAKDFLGVYKSGEPTLRVVARCALVYDPRDGAQTAVDTWDNPSTWTWSDNPALCILDYLRHPDGRNLDISRFDLQSFRDFADLCDQSVALKHGGTEKRYRLSGSYQLTDEPTAVMQRLLATCDGEIYRTTDGLVGIRGGQWVAPTITFQGDAILAYSLSQGSGKMTTFNRTAITYTSPVHDFNVVEADPWVDAASEALLGSLPTSLSLDMVPSASQARRLAKINAHKANPDWKGTISLDISGLNALNERVIQVVLPDDDLGLTETFLVTKAQVAADLSRVDLTVVSLDAGAYAWDEASEEGEAPPIVPTLTPSAGVPTPTGLTASVVTGTYGGVVVSSIGISVTPPADTSLLLVVRWAVASSGDWEEATAVSGAWAFNTGVLADGVSYDVEAKFVATTTEQSAWTATTTVTISASGSAPAAPSSLTASVSGSVVTLGAVAPNSSSVNRVVFWRSAGTTFGSATRLPNVYCAPNQTVSASDSPGTGTWNYWATAESAGGLASSDIGYVTVTV